MKKSLLLVAVAALSLNMQAQPPSDTTTKYPQGATYKLTDGSTVTKTDEELSSSTQYYNVVQVTNGTLTLNNCTFTHPVRLSASTIYEVTKGSSILGIPCTSKTIIPCWSIWRTIVNRGCESDNLTIIVCLWQK